MAKKGGTQKEVLVHPLAVTYVLATLLVLSLVALVAVTMNCTNKAVFVDFETGEIISDPEFILNQ